MSNGNKRDAEALLSAMAEMLNEYFGSEEAEAEDDEVDDLLPDLVAAPANEENATVTDVNAPWACAHPKMTLPFQARMPEELHMKLTWLKDNLPNTSMQKLVLQAIEEKANELLKQHYKPDSGKAS